MLKARIAVLVSGGGTNLHALMQAKRDGKIPCGEIVLVVSDKPGAYALVRAQEAGIPTCVISKEEYITKAQFEQKLRESLEENHIDLIVLAGFLRILSLEFTSRYPKRIINIHPSLIPSFCGKGYYGIKVHQAALSRGVKVTGATVHYVNEIADGGEIILQRVVKVNKQDTPESLQKRVMEQAEWKILPKAVDMVSRRIAKEKRNG